MQPKTGKYAAFIIPAIALIYALFAGLRTVGDPDLGWQLATGRWIVQHRAIPATDVLSYTAAGREWIYPALSQLILYGSYRLGGYSLLSWLGALACVATVAFLLRGPAISRVLAVLAVPLIAARSIPRAEMFTVVLFAVFLAILWQYHKGGRQRLWILPLLMALWVNLHLGFIAGLGMCAAYVFLELDEALFANDSAAPLQRLRAAAPWLLATLLATMLNPWGPRIYLAMVRQADILRIHNQWILEWTAAPVTLSRLSQAFAWRDPRSSLWWLMAAALAAMLAALWQRRIGPALLLATSLYLCLHSIRLQASFACVTAVVGGSILADALPGSWLARLWRDRPDSGFRSTIAAAAAVLLIAFATVRIGDLVSDRYFLQTPDQYSLFGSGAPSWYPEQAVSFLARQRLPGNLFTEYNLGGFAAWRLSPAYPVYIDGRAVPFGSQLFFRSLELLQQPLDSPEWQSEASARDIHTVLVSLDFVLGGGLPRIDAFCRSQQWSPVYLDTRAAIFVRAAPGDNRFDGLRIDCNQVRFDAPPDGAGVRGNADRFHYYLNSAAILLVLGRSPEAQRQLELAERIFSASSSLHYLKGLALVYNGFPSDAEREFRTSLRLDPADRTFQALALLYRQQGRYVEAAALLDRAVKNSIQPYQLLLTQGYVQLEMGAPAQALLSFDQAATGSPFVGEALPLGTEFNSQLAEGRENAWSKLADFYDARGLQTEALHARQQADSIARSREKSAPPQPLGD